MPEIKIAEMLVNVGSNTNSFSFSGLFTPLFASLAGALTGALVAYKLNSNKEEKQYQKRLKDEEEKIKQENLNNLECTFLVFNNLLDQVVILKREVLNQDKYQDQFNILGNLVKSIPNNEQIIYGEVYEVVGTSRLMFQQDMFSQSVLPFNLDKISFIRVHNEDIISLFLNTVSTYELLQNSIKNINAELEYMRKEKLLSDSEKIEDLLNALGMIYDYRHELEKNIYHLLHCLALLGFSLFKVLKIIDKDKKGEFTLPIKIKKSLEGYSELEKWLKKEPCSINLDDYFEKEQDSETSSEGRCPKLSPANLAP